MSVDLSRRTFLAGGASLVGIASVGVLVPQASAAPSDPAALSHLALRRSAFLPLVGQTFRIVHDHGALNVVLRQVRDLKPTVQPGAEYQFSLIFTDARSRRALSQRTYSIRHARSGRISLFIVPVGGHQRVQRYQAIIDSRLGSVTA